MPNTVEQWLKLHAVAGGSQRYWHLNELEAWYWRLQYSDRLYTWNSTSYPSGHSKAGQPIPAREKQPLIRYPLARRMVTEAADLLIGEGRFPSLKVDGDAAATDALTEILRKSKLRRRLHQVIRMTLAVGAGCVAWQVEAGRLVPIYWPAKHCEPVFGEDDPGTAQQLGIEPDDLVSLRVQYLYPKEELVGSGGSGWETIWYAFRRDYTTTAIINYEPVRVGREGADLDRVPQFTASTTIPHAYGFCPAEWFRTEDVEDSSEGSGLYEYITDILEDLDYQLSRLSGAVEYNVDPLMVFSGIHHQEMPDVQAALARGKGNTLNLGAGSAGVERKAEYLEIEGTSIELSMRHIQEQRARALECAQVVIQRHEEGAGAQSGISLRLLYRPMLSLIGGYREPIGDSVERLCRKALVIADLRRAELSALTLPAYEPGEVVASWPPVFEPTAEEVDLHARSMVALSTAGLLSRETGIERTATLLGIEDVEAEKARIEAEKAEMMAAVEEAAGLDEDDEDTGEDDGNAPPGDPSDPAA